MSRIRVIICRVEEEEPAQMREIGSYDLPEVALWEVQGETTLDEIERVTHAQGHAILRGVVQAQWAEIDEKLARAYRQRFSPSGSNA